MSEHEVEAVLRAHVYQGRNGYAEEPYGICTCGWSFDAGGDVDELARWSAHVAEALAPLIAERERVAAERALAPAWKVLLRACHHCGRLPDEDGDHSCTCPTSDSECLLHTMHPVAPLEPIRAALSTPQTADAPEGHGDADEAGERP